MEAPAALVTGASTGIGAATARRLADDGHDVCVHYHQDRDGAEATARSVEQAGQDALVMQADLGDPEAAWNLGEHAAATFGRLEVLVNNAGLYPRQHAAEVDPDDWRSTVAVNLDGAFHVTRALSRQMRERSGRIVFLSSIAAFRGSGHGAHYAAAKAGLLGLTRSLAQELAPEVRVNAVAPGYIDTDMLAGDSPQKRAEREREVPLKRVGSPQDVAAAVAFLCGPDSAYVTGQAVHVNGGLWMG